MFWVLLGRFKANLLLGAIPHTPLYSTMTHTQIFFFHFFSYFLMPTRLS